MRSISSQNLVIYTPGHFAIATTSAESKARTLLTPNAFGTR